MTISHSTEYLNTNTYMQPSYREWRERQQEEIAKRDEESKARRQETISKAERALDNFYEEYTAKRKAQIAQNKYV